ncbi:MAG: hypothetical protein RLZ66_1015 [Pseudomonadota bacterium]
MKTHRWGLAHFSWACCFGGLVFCSASQGADSFQALSQADKPAKAKKNKGAKKPPVSGSAESPAQRDQRLWRECRGKPNAGACEGFAS